jgi:predicted phosphodiesterase
MRYAIVSDIHANLAAWQTVLADIADMRADKIICLGDVLGYGPKPVEVLESVYRVVQVTLMGNHDAAVCGKLNPDTFSPRAKAAVSRHREQLSEAGMAWLTTLPFEFSTSDFRCAHGDFSDPGAFRYIIGADDALPSWKATREQLLFVGHSHLPGIYVIGASGKPHFVEPCDFELEEGKRYIINPGSVGYPRVGDCRSSYCVYDDRTKSILFRQLPFDGAGYCQALREAGLGEDHWLQERASLRSLPSLRERLSFSKPGPKAAHVQEVYEHAGVNPAARSRPRPLSLLLLLGFAACAAGAAGLSVFFAGRTLSSPALAVTVPAFDLPSVNAYPLSPGKNLLPILPDALSPDGRMESWRYAFEDRTRQSFATGLRDGAITLCIRNAGPCKAQLESPLINLAGTQLSALRLRGQIRKSDAFSGTVFYQLATYTSLPDGTLEQVAVTSLEVRSSKRKASANEAALNRKIELGKRVTHVRFRVEAEFDGTLELGQPTLAAAGDDAAAAKKGNP